MIPELRKLSEKCPADSGINMSQERLRSDIYIEFNNDTATVYSSRRVTQRAIEAMNDVVEETVIPPKWYCHACDDPVPTFDTEEELKVHEAKVH